MPDLSTTLLLLRIVKAILEVAFFALVGQGVLWVLVRAVGREPSTNFVWRVLDVVVSPFNRVVRWITPRFVADRHVPFATLGLLAVGWVWVAIFAIGNACVNAGIPVAECVGRR